MMMSSTYWIVCWLSVGGLDVCGLDVCGLDVCAIGLDDTAATVSSAVSIMTPRGDPRLFWASCCPGRSKISEKPKRILADSAVAARTARVVCDGAGGVALS